MKTIFSLTLLLGLLVNFTTNAQQITTDSSASLESLISNNLAEGCVEITNITSSVNGSSSNIESYGYFEKGASNFPFENGIVLSTGNVNSAGNVVNTEILAEGDDNWKTDTDLEDALNISNTINATSVEFDFVSFSNQIQFNYLLASEEYYQNNPCEYSDGFAFLIREAGSSDPYQNIALIPGTNTPVNTKTIHENIVGFCPAENEAYFDRLNSGDTNFNGRTKVLTANAAITPNVKYHIKLVIADQTDYKFDSAVFIEGNSFNASVDLGPDISTCATTVDLDANINNNQATYSWFLNDVLIPGATDPEYKVEASGRYTVQITIQVNSTSCIITDDIEITLEGEQVSTGIQDYILCDDKSNDGIETFDFNTKNDEIRFSVPSGNYVISYHTSNNDAVNKTNSLPPAYENKANPETIHVRIEDIDNGCLAFSTFNLMVNEVPDVTAPEPLIVCEDLDNDGFVIIDLTQADDGITNNDSTLQVTYHYSQEDADSGFYPIYPPYQNTNPTDTLFVRVYNPFTGCHNTTTIEVTVKPNPKINIEDPHWINACEENSDGFAVFDLTTVLGSILNGVTDAGTTFHLNEEDAMSGLNKIENVTDYENVNINTQIIYVRVEDAETGCYSITTVQLTTNLVQNGNDYDRYSVCDDISNDGIEDFNLLEIEEDIIREYGANLEVIFYRSQEDLDAEINPLNKAIPLTVNTSPTTIYTQVVDDLCIVNLLIDLVINPALELPDINSLDYCDTDTDGFTSIVLETFNAELTQGISPVTINYYLSETDALNDENRLPETYFNDENPKEIFIRVTNPQSGCVAVKPIQLNIITAPAVNFPDPIIICDDDQDAFSIIDLTQIVPDIVSDTSNLEISYFDDYGKAFNNQNPIDTPESFNATNQNIYFRVESTTTSCFNISTVFVNVNTLPVFPDISTFENCESDGNEITDFYFYTKDTEILNGQSGKQVLYFETEQDAINRTNEIDKFNAYENKSNPQDIFVRVESISDQDCYGTSSFDLEVGSIPLFNEPEDFRVCDDISNDAIEIFDLNSRIEAMKAGINDNLTITLHTSSFDAENGFNEIDPVFSNTVNPQQIYARITNGTYCHGTTSFALSVVQVPNTTEPSPLRVCDTDYDGLATFDLTLSELQILDLRQNNLEITYHTSQTGVDNHTEIITDPENFNNLANPSQVFIKINNVISDCYVSLPIDLVVDLPPPIIRFDTYEICDNPSRYFDLNTINSEISDNDSDAIISYYSNDTDAENGTNAISTDYNYVTTNDTIFLRIESASRGCHYVYPFQLKINPLPIANQPNDLEICDDSTADGFEFVNLASVNNSILGGQNPVDFTVSYYDNLASANSAISSLSSNFNTQNGQTIYARIENNVTGCYSTTQFNTIVHLYPNNVDPLVQCDVDYDETVVFDISTNEAALFAIPSDNIIVSFYDNLDDIDNDAAAISNPTNYTNLSQPQNVYIKVFNISANCYNIISQELIVTSPPEIIRFNTYEICDNPTKYFNLSTIDNIIVNNDSDALISYYSTALNAENGIDALGFDYNYTTTSDTIYIRIESRSRGCHYVYPFQLIINPLPIAITPNNMEACDDDYDNSYEFDLTQQNSQIIGNQNANDFEISYFLDENNANGLINKLNDFHTVNTDAQIYARIENKVTGCYSLTNFLVFVRRKPVNNIEDQVICLDNFPLQVNVDTGFPTDTYLWLPGGQTTPEIDITEIGDYNLTVTSAFGCVTSKSFNVIESEQATIEFEETVDFSDPNNITITISGIGDYLYQIDDEEPQRSNFFDNVRLGLRKITIIDLNGCSSVTKDVMVFDTPKYFTPNNDGYNDTWHITGVDQLNGTLIYIYNRQGKLLKTLPHTSIGWDGTYNGANMPADDYWFNADINYKGERLNLQGHFALKR
ncbi:T9SS type B sorting domain-containing protein [Algibacter mikhailovii]|nr:choice-of-anchor L domain-containing protein [Algibacter mikhailovii]